MTEPIPERTRAMIHAVVPPSLYCHDHGPGKRLQAASRAKWEARAKDIGDMIAAGKSLKQIGRCYYCTGRAVSLAVSRYGLNVKLPGRKK